MYLSMDPGKCELARLDALGFGQLVHLLYQCQVLHQTTQYRLQTTQYRSQTTRYRLQSSANHRLLSRLSRQFCLAPIVTGHQCQHRPIKLLTGSQVAMKSMPTTVCRLPTGCCCSVPDRTAQHTSDAARRYFEAIKSMIILSLYSLQNGSCRSQLQQAFCSSLSSCVQARVMLLQARMATGLGRPGSNPTFSKLSP